MYESVEMLIEQLLCTYHFNFWWLHLPSYFDTGVNTFCNSQAGSLLLDGSPMTGVPNGRTSVSPQISPRPQVRHAKV